MLKLMSWRFNYLQIYDGESSDLIDTLCGLDPIVIEGLSSSVRLVFVSDEDLNEKGFTLYWTSKFANTR